jgi:hypothetical protein
MVTVITNVIFIIWISFLNSVWDIPHAVSIHGSSIFIAGFYFSVCVYCNVLHSIMNLYFVCFHFHTILSKVAINICVQVFLWIYIATYLKKINKVNSGILRYVWVYEEVSTLFQTGITSSTPTHQCATIPVVSNGFISQQNELIFGDVRV